MNTTGRWVLAFSAMAFCAIPTLALEQSLGVSPVDTALEPYVSMVDSVKLPDGRHFHLVCMGKGSPTVILTAGLGDWAGSAWEQFQPEVAKITRVCSWDRPGFGLSDGVRGKASAATNASDLEVALSRRAIQGPYVMVGHSLGAYETLLYTDRNPSKVVGMVLIDPSYPDMAARAKRIWDRFQLPDPGPMPGLSQLRQCVEDVRRGILKAGGSDPDKCVTFPASYPDAVKAAMTAQYTASPRYWETAAAFLADGTVEGSKLVMNPERNYGNLPLLVLTSTVHPQNGTTSERAYQDASDALWNQAHEELAALSRRGMNIRVPGADHYIHRSQPQAVLDAIKSVIREAREASTK